MSTPEIALVFAELDPIHKRVSENETNSIEARWEFGQYLLKLRVGKQLQKGLRSEIKDHFGLEASEITRRMKLAEIFPTHKQVVDACAKHGGSWRRIIREELTKNPREEKTAPVWCDYAKAWLDKLAAEARESDDRHAAFVKLLSDVLDDLYDSDAKPADDAEAES
jgi:hypothetical protein